MTTSPTFGRRSLERAAIPIITLLVLWLACVGPAAAQQDVFEPILEPVAPALGFALWFGRVLGVGALLIVAIRMVWTRKFDGAALFGTIFAVFTLMLAGPFAWWASSFTQPPPSSGGGGGAGQVVNTTCYLCAPIMDRIATSLRNFREYTYAGLAGPAFGIARLALFTWVIVFAVGLLLSPDEYRSAGMRFAKQAARNILAFGMLAAPSWMGETLLRNVEQTALNVGRYMLDTSQSYFAATGVGYRTVTDYSGRAADLPYSTLWAEVEGTILPLLKMFFTAATDGSWYEAGEVILALFIATPFVFVAGVFLAFLVQTMFYVAAVYALMPIFIALMPFEAPRSMMMNGLKFALGGWVTLMVASIAMGITGSLILDIVADAGRAALLQQAAASGGTVDWSRLAAEAPNAVLNVDQPYFYLVLGAGAVSVILHLAAPRIASAITGVMDTATNAAIVVAATQAAMTYALMKGRGAAGSAAGMAGSGAMGLAKWGLDKTGISDAVGGFKERMAGAFKNAGQSMGGGGGV